MFQVRTIRLLGRRQRDGPVSELRNLCQADPMKPITLTDGELQTALAGKGGGRGHGRPAMFPHKVPGMIYLTVEARSKLRNLSAAAAVSQSDFLETLIRRYGAKAEADLQDAAGVNDAANVAAD